MNRKNPVFFLVKNRALGDSVMGLSSVQYLRALYPDSIIIYAVPDWVAPLYKNVKTDADIIYPLKLKSLWDVVELYTDLINLKVDAIHEMHQSGTGKKVFSLFSFIKNIPYTFHNHHLKNGTKVVDQGVIKELIQRDLDGIYSYYAKNKNNKPHFIEFAPKLFPVDNLEKYPKPLTVIMGVVATRATKMWPLSSYVELARLILKKNPNYSIVIPLSKSAADKKIKETILALDLPSNLSIVHWDLSYLPEAFSQASFYIGNDTGLKHLAVAVGIKTFTFFGPEPAREWHPYDCAKHPYFYLEGLACRTRTHHYCGLSVCDLKIENMQCLNFFKAEDIFLKIESYI